MSIDMKTAIREILSRGPTTAPLIASEIYSDLPDYQQRMQQSKVRHHLYMMERDGEVDRDTRGHRKLSTWRLKMNETMKEGSE